MVNSQTGRYSKYLRPISYGIDLSVILLFALIFLRETQVVTPKFILFLWATWSAISYFNKFYNVYRFTSQIEIVSKLIYQIFLFTIFIIAYFPFTQGTRFDIDILVNFSISTFCLVFLFKFLFYFNLKRYRLITGDNFRNVIIIGTSEEAYNLKRLFETRPDLGYRFLGFFAEQPNVQEGIGSFAQIPDYIQAQSVDEIYCSMRDIDSEQLQTLVELADNNRKTIKFIPDSTQIHTKNLKIDYYELFPVLTLQKTILHDPFIKGIKRLFDILFSLIVIVFVLSWLTPIIALLIKLESKGPIFFKQGRPGLDEKEFMCYKFRSMHLNEMTEKEASKNDPRVTRMGRFMRKTSVDELPQFFNVLLGDMSVVGPRPHLWSQNKAYASRIKKYMVRLYVKPGITGLAQVKGYRGEIETEEDMVNRIKLDVFYIENWSMILDLKIILQTVINIFKGEEKAY